MMHIGGLSIFSSSRRDAAPLSQIHRCAYDTSEAAIILPASYPLTAVAGFRVDSSEVYWLTDPARTESECLVNASIDDSADVAPPAVAAQKLAHQIISMKKVVG